MVDLRAVQLGRVACSASGWGRIPALQWSLLRPFWIRAPYRGMGHTLAGMTKWIDDMAGSQVRCRNDLFSY